MTTIDIGQIHEVSNVRTDTNDPSLTALMESIQQYGLWQAVGVIKVGPTKYNLLWGHRRFAAVKKLGWTELAVGKQVAIFDRAVSEADYILINIAENVQRKDINPIELGAAAVKLNEEKHLSFPEIAARLNLPISRVTLAVDTFLNTPAAYRSSIGFIGTGGAKSKEGVISASTVAYVVHTIPPADRERVLDEIKKHEIPVKFLKILHSLLDYGMPLDEAMKKMYDYRQVSLDLLLTKSVADELEHEHNMPIHDVIRWFLKQGIRPRKDLIFDPETATREVRAKKS